MYDWRNMKEGERKQVLELRKARNLPWHTPPHLDFNVARQYLLSSSCYEHVPVIGKDAERMTACESEVLETCQRFASRVDAWCILPNHYHVLLRTEHIKDLRKEVGQFHGRSSFVWNRDDDRRGRKVWYNCFERPLKSERHFWATLNYVHHNPVRHGYVRKWPDWPWSSARLYLEEVGPDEAKKIWQKYPILDYGKQWDI